ncbi:MAG: hypothetical protein HY280_09445 [Nitrospinae bacterium]|nr:hypothetical protein [Nitrospinota bacterium]
MESILACPKCGTEINVNDVLYDQLQKQIRKDFEAKAAKKDKEIEAQEAIKKEREKVLEEKQQLQDLVNGEVKEKVKIEKTNLEKSLRKEIQFETEEQIKELQKNLENKSGQVRELNKT